MKKLMIFAVMVCLCNTVPSYAHQAKKEVAKDNTMQKIDDHAQQLIRQQGDYNAALKVYAEAAREYADQPYYKEQYSVLRRVIKMKRAMQALAAEPELSAQQQEKWDSYYQAVRGYYYEQGYYTESVALDKAACEKLKTLQATLNHLETLIVLDQTSEAGELMGKVAQQDRQNPEYLTLQLLVQARDNAADTAAKTAQTISMDPAENPRAQVYLACIAQRNQDRDQACQYIVTALENTAPTQITMTRKLIANMQEFKSLTGDEKYQAALNTESKVYQSGCTGGSSCNSCSLKGKCSSTK